MHVIGLPRDPLTKKEIPLNNNHVNFVNKVFTFGNKEQTIKELSTALRKRNETERQKEIKKIATTILPDLENDYRPVIPKERIKWEFFCRDTIKGVPNRLKYRPQLLEVVKDDHPFKFLLWGRQWGKTTILASDLAYNATTKYDYDQVYFNFKKDNLTTFTENKFRQDVFGTTPLSHFIFGVSKLGAMNRVVTKNRCITDFMLPGFQWGNPQGKTIQNMQVDEGQDHTWEYFQNARQTQSDSHGKLTIAGIGGHVDTIYHGLWKSTNQMEYLYDKGDNYLGYENMSWRKDLEYDSEGLIEDDYLTDVQKGKWDPLIPENNSRHGYHLSQLQNPRIPLTIQDAVEKYKISEEWSIEWQEKKDPNYTQSEFRRNILAEFVQGEVKPISREDMNNLFDDDLSLTLGIDVDHKRGPVIIGIDIGGSNKTIVWIWQCTNSKAPIFELLWAEKIETNNVREQLDICINLIDAYEADFISIDSGGGIDRTQGVQDKYGSRSVRVHYSPRVDRPIPTDAEFRLQESEMRYVIDRTFSIGRIISLVKHPYTDGDFTSNRLILPGKDRDKLKWIVEQFVAIEGKRITSSSGRSTFVYINDKPDDALQACNYAFIGWDIWRGKGRGHYGGPMFSPNDNSYDMSRYDY